MQGFNGPPQCYGVLLHSVSILWGPHTPKNNDVVNVRKQLCLCYNTFRLDWYLLGDSVHDVNQTMHTLGTFEWTGSVCLVYLVHFHLTTS